MKKKLSPASGPENNLEMEFLDYADLCAFLKISRGTARNWKSAGRLPYTHIHGKVLFPKKDLLRILRKNAIKSTGEFFQNWEDSQSAGYAEQVTSETSK